MICFLSNFSPCFKSPPDNGDFDGDGENFFHWTPKKWMYI